MHYWNCGPATLNVLQQRPSRDPFLFLPDETVAFATRFGACRRTPYLNFMAAQLHGVPSMWDKALLFSEKTVSF